VDVLIQCFYALSLVAHFLLPPKHLHAFSKQLRSLRSPHAPRPRYSRRLHPE